ncbi:MAG: sulfite exporter TauE/SafE family protein [Gemmatimonadaceae bacterium]
MLASAAGSAVNSIAGGGTLLTFPALVGLGVPAIVANATSTVALVPGTLGASFGYRSALTGARAWAVRFAIPSLLGGVCGALLLLVTPPDRFDAVVPWLVLGATLLFVIQRPLMRLLRRHSGSSTEEDLGDPTRRPMPFSIVLFQFAVAIYGGYFGAGIGILMLAALGFMGLSNIHRMNGLKAIGGTAANLAAAVTFALSSLVQWPVAGAMMVGAIVGGYGGSRIAQRVSQDWVRRAIVAIGFGSGLWLLSGGLR